MSSAREFRNAGFLWRGGDDWTLSVLTRDGGLHFIDSASANLAVDIDEVMAMLGGEPLTPRMAAAVRVVMADRARSVPA